MTSQELFQDINTGCLTEVAEAATSYYSDIRGLTVHQRFYIYPSGTIVCLSSVDGGSHVSILEDDDEVCFQHIHRRYFN
jgi:hypothetical protein